MLINLLKKEFSYLFVSFQGGTNKKTSKASKVFGAALVVGLIAYIMLMSAMYSDILIEQLEPIGASEFAVLLMFIVTCTTNTLYTIIRSSSVLFTFKDFDLLVSLPIQLRTIISSKLIFIYLSNLLFQSVIMIPNIVVWMTASNPEMVQILFVVLAFPFVGLIPVVISSLLGTIISAIAAQFRKPAIFTSIFSILVACGAIVLSFFVGGLENTLSENAVNITEYLSSQIVNIYPVGILYLGLIQGDVLSLIGFIVISILCFIIFVVICAKYFVGIRSRLSTTSVRSTSKDVRAEVKLNGIMKSLYIKELKKLISIPIYAMNFVFTPILGILGLGAAFFLVEPEVFSLISGQLQLVALVFAPLAIAFLVAYVSTSACSLSLEGSSLWLLKTLPYRGDQILNSYVQFNVIFNLPFAIIFSTAVSLIVRADFLWTIILFVFPLTMCGYTSYLGLILNLRFPRFDWDNPASVVKRAASVMIIVFANIGLFMGLGMLFATNRTFVEYAQAVYLGITLMMAIFVFCTRMYVKKNGDKILLNL